MRARARDNERAREANEREEQDERNVREGRERARGEREEERTQRYSEENRIWARLVVNSHPNFGKDTIKEQTDHQTVPTFVQTNSDTIFAIV